MTTFSNFITKLKNIQFRVDDEWQSGILEIVFNAVTSLTLSNSLAEKHSTRSRVWSVFICVCKGVCGRYTKSDIQEQFMQYSILLNIHGTSNKEWTFLNKRHFQ